MQNYHGNTGDYMRRGNTGRCSRMNSCQNVNSTPSPVSERTTECCEKSRDTLEGMPLAMAYVPWQTWRKIMCPEMAFKTGTIFEELNKPFWGMGGCR